MPDYPPGSQPPSPLIPPTPTGEPHSDLAVRLLYDETARLRAEVDQLREKQAQEAEQKSEKKEGGEEKGGGEQKDGNQPKAPAQQKEPARERARHWVRTHPFATVGIVLGTVLLIVVGVFFYLYLSSYETTDDAFVDGHTDPISPRISGFVTGVYVENTTRVRKGQLLIQIDPRDNQVAKENSVAQLSQSKAAVAAQEPNVPITAVTQSTQEREAENNVVAAEANVASAQERYQSALADLHQAEANEMNAAREEERYRLLVVKEEVSREQYDQQATNQRAQAAVVSSRRETADSASKQVDTARAQLGTAQQQLKQTRENLPRQIAIQRATLLQRQAQAQAAQAQADQAELNLEYTRIYAPEDGIIGDKQVQLNDQVAAGTELFALTQTNDIWITANFKETAIVNMRPGQSCTIYVDALKEDFEGYVEALPGGTGAIYSLLPPENATGNYVKVVQRLPVRIRFRPGQRDLDRLAPGMSVEPKVWVK
jgi:membrane fusion protein, multidrug efflux system